jgi:alkyldihydroxyacetonephosphate synthase
MRRWNGWGDDKIIYPLPASAAVYLANLLGPGQKLPDAALESVVASVPPTRHPADPMISDDPLDRLFHARGQSLPDWVDLRSGRIKGFPSGIAYPETEDQVNELLNYGRRNQVRIIPYGGGTSVVGHINPLADNMPSITVDLRQMAGLIDMDHNSRLATFWAGVTGPQLEKQLQQHGMTLGHFPQSFEYSTLGGWIATRSSGQQSYYYGRIEDSFAGGRLLTFDGPLDLPAFPASAAGPDLRHMVLGSEGRLGIITKATMRVRPVPEKEQFYAAFFHDWDSGMAALRDMAQAKVPVSMLRLSDAQETETTLVLSGKDRILPWANRGLRFFGYNQERCLLLYSVTGKPKGHGRLRRQISSYIRAHGGLPTGGMIGEQWRKSRFRTPYLRNTLWEQGYAIDTLETAVCWSAVNAMTNAVKEILRDGLTGDDERVLVFCHLSHVYCDGASIYFTYLFRRSADPDRTLAHWQRLKQAASEQIVAHGGTISHQHGVGIDHARFLVAEKGQAGLRLLEAACQTLDPDGLLNPGKLLADRRDGSELDLVRGR